ncbi:MAG: AAA family ATPase [Eubacteriales bacterium]|jgi:MoxR-like ATPase
MDMQQVVKTAEGLTTEVEKIIVGKHNQIQLIVMAVLADGHILLDDLPGSGKTTLVKALSIALGCSFRRVQFTPDLLPSDIIGMNIFNQKTREFQFMEGPVNTNILLADEINRAIPRTQSALLEAMEERQVTVDGESRTLPQPFLVMATQNPVESESTFQLPAAQMDRFLVKLSLGYPTAQEEQNMLANLGDGIPFEQVQAVTSPQELVELQQAISQVHVSDMVSAYLVELVHRTRENKLLRSGASPRASRSLYRAGKAWAAMQGREYVTPDDIQAIAPSILVHRVQVSSEARFAGTTAEEIIGQILAETPVPPAREDLFHGN